MPPPETFNTTFCAYEGVANGAYDGVEAQYLDEASLDDSAKTPPELHADARRNGSIDFGTDPPGNVQPPQQTEPSDQAQVETPQAPIENPSVYDTAFYHGSHTSFEKHVQQVIRASEEPQSSSVVPTQSTPIDLDDIFSIAGGIQNADDDSTITASIFQDVGLRNDSSGVDEEAFEQVESVRYFNNPNQALLDNDASLIPGSPFSKPAAKRSSRPQEPLTIAKYASSVALLITFGWVCALFYAAIWDHNSIGRALVEAILAVFSFFGLFWNTYFIVSSVFKCFIPAKAFKTNTKYCSIIPETKPPDAAWLNVTIQIPVYKESLQEVMIPTLKSCMKARDHYIENSRGAHCNIVICDDGLMAFLQNNFAAAEMLWDAIVKSSGRMIKLSKLIKSLPRASQTHLRGMRSKNVYEAFYRLLFYYHYNIGFVARSTVDRRGKFKKASNINSHLQLALGAAQRVEKKEMRFADALLKEAYNSDGSRHVMFGNNVRLGHLICVNDADARMAESVIIKTVPEFLNDPYLGFTQHATKTMTEQRSESFYTHLLSVYTDALYQGHFLLSSIMGCHPPLCGHSIFLRTEAVKQCARMRMLRKAQRWLQNLGLGFLPVDQVGFSNLQAQNRAEYWSESHVSEDFELMIHLYNLGFNGRYCAYENCEFEEGITRTFDEEAGRHRKFALGAHELIFNPLQEMIGHGVFTPLFRTFMSCDIPSYYKIFLVSYLCSYSSGGCYLIVFTVAAIAHLADKQDEVDSISAFSPAGVIVLNVVAFYVIGYITFLISLLRMHWINNKLLFPEYRKSCCGSLYIIFVKLRYSLVFQFFFYTVASITFYFLGSMDHLLSRPNICGATNKDSITISRCSAFWEMAKFNVGSWGIAVFISGLAYLVVLEDESWSVGEIPENLVNHALFSGPALFLSIMCFISPIVLNPFILGWPFHRQPKPSPEKQQRMEERTPLKKDGSRRGGMMGLKDFMDCSRQLDDEIDRAQNKKDLEIGTIRDLYSADGTNVTGSPNRIHPALAGRQYSDGRSSIGSSHVISDLYRKSSKCVANSALKPVSASETNKSSQPQDLDKKARKMVAGDMADMSKKARKLVPPNGSSFNI